MLLVLVLRVFLLDIMRVQGVSMMPTLRPRQVIYVNRTAFGLLVPFRNNYVLRWGGPRKGQLVVFRNPLDGHLAVKRCVGEPGEPIRLLDESVQVGGRTLPISREQHARLLPYRGVPSASIFVAGDNPLASVDSRDYGVVPIEDVYGRVIQFHSGASAPQLRDTPFE
jgi:signal peptidase I